MDGVKLLQFLSNLSYSHIIWTDRWVGTLTLSPAPFDMEIASRDCANLLLPSLRSRDNREGIFCDEEVSEMFPLYGF